jgi:hypothetical protein
MVEENSKQPESQPDQNVGQAPVLADKGSLQVSQTQQPSAASAPIAQKTEPPKQSWIGKRWWGAAKATENSNRIIALATLVVALATVVSTYEIVTGSNDTKKMVQAAQDINQALTAENSQNQTGFEQTLRQSRASLDAAIEQYRSDQRAWIGISGLNLQQPTTVGKPFVVEVWMTNNGKTPATLIATPVSIFVARSPVPKLRDALNIRQEVTNTLFPGLRYGPDLAYGTMGDNSRVIQAEDISAYANKRLWVYIYGKIEYKDIFGISRVTSYCGVANGSNNFGGCPSGAYPAYAK